MPLRAHRPLPETLDEIDAAWLTAAFRTQAPGATVRGFRIIDIARGTCTKVRLRLDLDDAGKSAGIPETVILKGGFEPHSRDMHYMHQNEIRGYRDVLPVLGLRSPTAYFADYDPEQRHGIVIMEDLVARGVDFCNPLRPQSHELVARRLSALAQFHAKTWGSNEFRAGGTWGWVEDVTANQRRYFDSFGPDAWQQFVASPRGAATSVRFHDRVWMDDTLDRIAKFSQRLPHAIVHCDTHLGNLYIDTDGAPGFFDSLPGRAPPMLEIAYHLACALDTADRPRWEGALVRHYLDGLAQNGVDTPGFDDAMRQYGIFLAFGFAVFMLNAAIFQPEAVNTAYTARFSAAMIDNDTIGRLASIV